MARMRLTDKADLGVMFDAEKICWDPELLKKHNVTRERCISTLSHCPSVGFECDGKPIGGILFDGQRAHIAVLPEYYGRWAVLFRPALEWLFSIKEPILVDIQADNERCLRFMDRNQWRRVKETDKVIIYELTRNSPVLTRAWNKKTKKNPGDSSAS